MTRQWRWDYVKKGDVNVKKYTIKINTLNGSKLVFNVISANLMRAFKQVTRKMFAKGFKSNEFSFDDFEVKDIN